MDSARKNFSSDKTKSRYFLNLAYKIAHESKDSSLICKAIHAMGYTFYVTGKLDSSYRLLSRILPRVDYWLSPDLSTRVKNTYGLVLILQSKYDQALGHYLKLVEHVRTSPYENAISDEAMFYNNIGLMYYHMGVRKMAIFYYKKSIDLKLRIGDGFDLSTAYYNLGLCYLNLNDIGNAEKSLSLMKRTCDSIPGDKCNRAILLKAMVDFRKEEYVDAEMNMRHAIRIFEETGDETHEYFAAKVDLAVILIKIKKYNEAIVTLEETRARFQDSGLSLVSLYNALLLAYEKTGDPRHLELTELFYKEKERISNIEIRKNLLSLQDQYNNGKKRQADSAGDSSWSYVLKITSVVLAGVLALLVIFITTMTLLRGKSSVGQKQG